MISRRNSLQMSSGMTHGPAGIITDSVMGTADMAVQKREVQLEKIREVFRSFWTCDWEQRCTSMSNAEFEEYFIHVMEVKRLAHQALVRYSVNELTEQKFEYVVEEEFIEDDAA